LQFSKEREEKLLSVIENLQSNLDKKKIAVEILGLIQ
jgi:hypothetical protein